METGVVKFFKPKKGWGAITVASLPAGEDVWVRYSTIEAGGYRELEAGDLVEVEYEDVQQDSFRHRALRVRRLSPGPAPTLRRHGGRVDIVPDGTPDTPLSPRAHEAGTGG